MNITPSISVITCLYNCPPELFERCIKGLISQTFKNFEVLIVNDGSTKYLDDNKKIIEKYCGDDNRFKYYDTEHTGKSQTLNFALRIAKGKYIAINDSDDVSYPERFEYQYSFLESNPEYDVISNAMRANPTNIIFPGVFESEAVTAGNLHYKANHPSQMFNREHVLNAVPFLFEQIYDSMEDNVFNHIMFHCGHLRMWYDNNVLVEYSQLNPDAVHYENLYGYKKEGSFKLFYHTFNAEKFHQDAQFTCILLINKNWKEEIERTLLNIRFTADCVKIILVVYDDAKINNELDKYDVKIYCAKNLADAINVGIANCETEYLMVISKPIRFYIHNWDMYAVRKLQVADKYKFVQPYITGIDKLNRDDYYNNNGKFERDYKLRTGNNLILMDKNMTEKRDSLVQYSEYTDLVNIPIIDDDLVFITTVTEMTKIQGTFGWDDDILLNVFLSLKEYATDKGWIWIDMDLRCGVINNFELNDYNKDEYDIKYLINMWKIAHFFLNETRFIYEKIVHDSIDTMSKNSTTNMHNFNKLGNQIMESVIKDENFNLYKKNFVFEKDMSYFLKNINLKYRGWDLTYQI